MANKLKEVPDGDRLRQDLYAGSVLAGVNDVGVVDVVVGAVDVVVVVGVVVFAIWIAVALAQLVADAVEAVVVPPRLPGEHLDLALLVVVEKDL